MKSVSHRRILLVIERNCRLGIKQSIMNHFKLLIAVTLLLSVCNCSSTNVSPLYYEDGIANLNGMWVSSHVSNSGDIIFDVDYSDDILKMTLMGQPIIYQSMSRNKDQILLTFKDTENTQYYMVGHLTSRNEMRLSFTTEEVKDIIPVGQIGETVYRVERVKKSRAAVVASRN